MGKNGTILGQGRGRGLAWNSHFISTDVISAKRYRLVSLNGKHNFNRKQTRLYTEL